MKNGLKRLVRAYMPKAFKMFNMTMNSKEVINYILELVKDIIEYREKNNVTSNDFMQSLIQLKNDDEKIEVNRNGNGNKTEGDNRIRKDLISVLVDIKTLSQPRGLDTDNVD